MPGYENPTLRYESRNEMLLERERRNQVVVSMEYISDRMKVERQELKIHVPRKTRSEWGGGYSGGRGRIWVRRRGCGRAGAGRRSAACRSGALRLGCS